MNTTAKPSVFPASAASEMLRRGHHPVAVRQQEFTAALLPNSATAEEVERELAAIGHEPVESGAQRIVNHMNETITKVHDHTLDVITKLEQRLGMLRERVVAKREESITRLAEYVEMSAEAIEISDKIEDVVISLEKSLERQV